MQFLLSSLATITIVCMRRIKARLCGEWATVHEHSLKMEESGERELIPPPGFKMLIYLSASKNHQRTPLV